MRSSLSKQTRPMRMSSTVTDEKRLCRCKILLLVPKQQQPIPPRRVLQYLHAAMKIFAESLYMESMALYNPELPDV